MKSSPMSVQLTSNLRYLPLSDEGGAFGLFIVTSGNDIKYTIQVETYDEFRATIESFQETPA